MIIIRKESCCRKGEPYITTKNNWFFLLDTRGPDEYEQVRLGAGETLTPIGAFRKRLGELPEDKDMEIICFCKISLRGYEAVRLLDAKG